MDSRKFAADGFYTSAGALDVSSTEPLTVAFLGGSLTEGHVDYEGTSLADSRLKWANVMIKYLSGLFPRRPLKAVNAGLGGTGTEYGVARFYRDVLSHEPDIIFVEFSCNDMPHQPSDCSENGRKERQIYLEGIIRQCAACKKVPVIIYMHVPLPFEGEVLRRYLVGCRYKQEVLDYYGIGTVDAMADFMREFEVESNTDNELTLHGYYDRYYNRKQSGLGAYDVHPNKDGYLLFASSLINALMSEPKRYIRRFEMKDTPYRAEFCADIAARYNYIPASSERITYVGEWSLYTKDHAYVTDNADTSIRESAYRDAHQFPDGIMQTNALSSEEFSFVTDADEICMPHITARAGLGVTVFADGVVVGKTSCRSPYHGMNFTGPWISLPKGEKLVKFVVDGISEDAIVFRFGYIVEKFLNK